jgi:sulfite exporter TauE/SafE
MGSMGVIVNGFFLGLATGPACLLSCSCVLLPMVLTNNREESVGRDVWPLLARFLSGRLVAYALVGLASGLASSSLESLGTVVPYWATLILAVLLMFHGLGLTVPCKICPLFQGLAKRKSFPGVLGMLTGLNLCPPFLLAVSWTWKQGLGPVSGMLFFLAFFLATSLFVLPIGWGGYLARNPAFAGVGRVSAFLFGAFFFLQCLAHGYR